MKNNQMFAALIAVFAVLGCGFILISDSLDSDADTVPTYTVAVGESLHDIDFSDLIPVHQNSQESGVLNLQTSSGSQTVSSSQYVLDVHEIYFDFTNVSLSAGTYTVTIDTWNTNAEVDDGVIVAKIIVPASSVSQADLEFTNTAPTQGISGSTYTYTATTNVPATFSKSGTWPSWLTLNTSTGAVSGTLPSVSSSTTYTYKIHAVSTSSSSNTADQTNTIHVYPIATITATNGNSVSGITGQSLSKALSCNLSSTFSVKTGSGYNTLPTGLSINSSNGTVSGTPTQSVSNYRVTIQAVPTVGPSQTATIVLTFNIQQAEQTLQITSAQPTGTIVVGNSVSYSLAANVTGTVFTLQNAPNWLSIDSGNYIRGSVPSSYTTAQDITFTIKATSPQGQTATQTPTLHIEPVLKFTSKPIADCIAIPHYTYNDDGTVDAGIIEDLQSGFKDSTSKRVSTFTFVFVGKYATSVTWDFGDGTTGEGFTVDHTYAKAGTYSVTCTATNQYDDDNDDSTPMVTGTDTKTIEVTVDADPSDYLYAAILIFFAIVVIVLVLKLIASKRRV